MLAALVQGLTVNKESQLRYIFHLMNYTVVRMPACICTQPETKLLCFCGHSFFTIQRGWTALKEASFNGHKKVVEVLLKAGANPNLQDKVRTER